jgi:hypothetical protein
MLRHPGFPNSNMITGSFIQRMEKSKAMYEALTTGYSMVYRGTTSPYSPGWRLEEHYQAFHNDENLAMIFLKIIREERKKCKLGSLKFLY